MNDIERELQQASLAQPSASLDQRMRKLFREATDARPHPLRRPVPVWLAAAACLGCAIVGFGARSLSLRSQPPPAVVVVVQPNDALKRFVSGHGPGSDDGFDFSRARIQVTTQPLQQL